MRIFRGEVISGEDIIGVRVSDGLGQKCHLLSSEIKVSLKLPSMDSLSEGLY